MTFAAVTLAGCGGGEATVEVVTQPAPALTQTDIGEIQSWLTKAYNARHAEIDGNKAQRYSTDCAATGPQVAACTLRVFDYASGEPFPDSITVSVSVSCLPSGVPEQDFEEVSDEELDAVVARINKMLESCTWAETGG